MSNELKTNKIVRARYAPSPTGLFHIGGARTALFNYLFAKKNNGDFIVRIEDTDIERNVEGGDDSQLNNLKWLKIFPDESLLNPGEYGPYKQSEKLNRYKNLAYKLLEEKKAYRCFCTSEKLEKDREEALKNNSTPKYNKTCLKLSEQEIEEKLKNNVPYSIRLEIKEDDVFIWNDLVRETISVPACALTDPIILKSNGYPMYNFCVVVDDYDMKITHVIRGEEHISNTPYQLAIKKALNFQNNILFGHLSVIVDDSGKKLSKRNLDLKQFIEDYKNMGFMPEVICNFMYLLGLPAPNNKEIFTLNEAIKSFDLSKVSKSATTFDFKKMEWISSEHFKLMTNTSFIAFVSSFITIDLNDLEPKKNDIFLLFKNQISYAKQLNELIFDTFFKEIDFKKLKKESEILKNISPTTLKFINAFEKEINELTEFNDENIKFIINKLKDEFNLTGKNLYMPIRLFSTHREHGPELIKMILILGKNKVVSNIKQLKTFLKNTKSTSKIKK